MDWSGLKMTATKLIIRMKNRRGDKNGATFSFPILAGKPV